MTNHEVDMGKMVYCCNYEMAKNSGFLCPTCKGLLVANFFEHTHGLRDDEWVGSEDFSFCRLARHQGLRVLVKANAFVGHLTIAKITEEGLTTHIKRGDSPDG